jgi:hypothetical protein
LVDCGELLPRNDIQRLFGVGGTFTLLHGYRKTIWSLRAVAMITLRLALTLPIAAVRVHYSLYEIRLP